MSFAPKLLTLSLRAYKLTLSPALQFLAGPLGGCRFTPTCSEYATEALRRHGALRGSWLAIARLARCQPWGGAGYDPVPGADPQPEGKCSLHGVGPSAPASVACHCHSRGVTPTP